MASMYFLIFLCLLQSFLFWRLKRENTALKAAIGTLKSEKETLARRLREAPVTLVTQ